MATDHELRVQLIAISTALAKIINIELIYFQPIKDKYTAYAKIHSKLRKKHQELEALFTTRSTLLGQVRGIFYQNGLEKRLDALEEKVGATLDVMLANERKYGAKYPKAIVRTSIGEVFGQTDQPNRMTVATFMREEVETRRMRNERSGGDEDFQGYERDVDGESFADVLGIIYEEPGEKGQLGR
jgi:hypothetical protein